MTELVVGESPGQLDKVILTIPEVDDDDLPSTFGDEDALLSVIDPSKAKRASSDKCSPPSIATTTTKSVTTVSIRSSELQLMQNPEGTMSVSSGFNIPKTCMQHLKLDFLSLGLIGRDGQVAALKDCLDRLMDGNASSSHKGELSTKHHLKQLVFLGGNSGSGKTTLSRSIEEIVTERYGGVLVEGKCEMQTRDEPFFGIAKALGKICIEVSNSGRDSKKLADELMVELGDKLEPLLEVIPELKQVIPDYKSAMLDADPDILDLENGLSRWKRFLLASFGLHHI
ncbi:unnamed protein product [Cylindrotheca closterium]|uniref:Uncharacterized protein n=1 Tax=Cylindrotheca closterium TaxID=2856 RepID=A0AAD2JHI4_9STRA|nr:unnamed protein product [Cylindrotheca closterium]